MTPIVEYLTNFEHVAREKMEELKKNAEGHSYAFVTSDNHRSEKFRRLVKDYVRYHWIQYLCTVKVGPLSEEEFSIGLTVFEVLYRA